jgi:hypothetical protein
MKPIRSVKHRMDFHISNGVIRSQSEQIHEHDFIQIAVKGSSTLIRCITCGIYYCEHCGKALSDIPRYILCA